MKTRCNGARSGRDDGAHPAPEIARYFDARRGVLVSVRDDGVSLFKRPGTGWKVGRRMRPGADLGEWRMRKLAAIAALPAWARQVRALPSQRQLETWSIDSVAETTAGDPVEPDGWIEGAPSWLLALGMV